MLYLACYQLVSLSLLVLSSFPTQLSVIIANTGHVAALVKALGVWLCFGQRFLLGYAFPPIGPEEEETEGGGDGRNVIQYNQQKRRFDKIYIHINFQKCLCHSIQEVRFHSFLLIYSKIASSKLGNTLINCFLYFI